MRNILWSGDLYNKKSVIVAWNTICILIKEDSLELRYIPKINKASSLNLR